MNSFRKQRAEKLEKLLTERGIDPFTIDEGLIDDLNDYLEKEIGSAFGRGVRHAKQPVAEGQQ